MVGQELGLAVDAVLAGPEAGPPVVGAGAVVGVVADVAERELAKLILAEIAELIDGAIVAAGLAPIEAIRAATTNAAQAFGLETVSGTLAEGRIADIIAVEDDPLADIGAMERVLFVMRSGRIARCGAC